MVPVSDSMKNDGHDAAELEKVKPALEVGAENKKGQGCHVAKAAGKQEDATWQPFYQHHAYDGRQRAAIFLFMYVVGFCDRIHQQKNTL